MGLYGDDNFRQKDSKYKCPAAGLSSGLVLDQPGAQLVWYTVSKEERKSGLVLGSRLHRAYMLQQETAKTPSEKDLRVSRQGEWKRVHGRGHCPMPCRLKERKTAILYWSFYKLICAYIHVVIVVSTYTLKCILLIKYYIYGKMPSGKMYFPEIQW